MQRLSRGPKFTPIGAPVVVGVARAAVPAGSWRELEVVTEKVIDVIAAQGGGTVQVLLETRVADSQDERTTAVGANFAPGCRKTDPYRLPWSGSGRIVSRLRGGPPKPVVTSTVIPGTEYEVLGGPITLSYNGVRARIAAGSKFTVSCMGQTEVARGRLLLTPYLERGRIDVQTTASMAQPAAYVGTGEGNLGTRRTETSRFTVSRDAATQRSVLRVQTGSSGAITPFNTRERSPCTAGTRLTVDHRGRISRG